MSLEFSLSRCDDAGGFYKLMRLSKGESPKGMRNSVAGIKRIAALCVLAVVVGSLTGCAIQERTLPISNTFLEDRDITAVDDDLPFNHAWIEPGLPQNYYSKVFFRSVTIDRLAPDAFKASKSIYMTNKKEFLTEAQGIADYFKEQLNQKVQKYPKGTFVVTESAEEHGLVFDIAITELEFSHPVTRAGAMLVPIPATGVLFDAVSDPHLAFAARVYDGKSGKLIATLADRKFPPTRILDLNKLTVTSSAREVCGIWADIFAEGLNREQFTKVESRGIFAILPW
jgi:hypothetical protein